MKLLKSLSVLVVVFGGIYFGLTYIKDNLSVQDEKAVKYSSTEEIDYQVTFENMNDNNDQYWEFEVKFDTHTIELDELVKREDINVFFDDEKILDEFLVLEKNGSGHHISYTLSILKENISKSEQSISEVTIKFNFENQEMVELIWSVKNYDWITE